MKLPGRRTLVVLACAALLMGLGAWRFHETRPDVRFRRGQEALRRGDRVAAERIVADLEKAGETDRAYLLRGALLYQQGQYADAVEVLNRIQDRGGLRHEAIALGGQALLQLGELREAERAFTFVLSEEPDHLEACRGLADLYYHQGALLRAVEYLERIMRLDANDGRAFWLTGHIYKDLDRKTEAIPYLKEALARSLPPARAEAAREELAELLVSIGEYRPALDLLRTCRPEADAETHQLSLEADALHGLGNTAEAQTLLDEGLHRHPNAASLLQRRARIHLEADQAAEAARLLEHAVSEEEDSRSRYLLAQAYERLERPTDAAEQRRRGQEIQDDLQELTKLNQDADRHPWDAAVRRRMAEVCRKLGKQELAAMWERSAAVCARSIPKPSR